MSEVTNDKAASAWVRPAKIAVPSLAALVAVRFLSKYFGVSQNKSYFSAAMAAGVTGLTAWHFTKPGVIGLENLLKERTAPQDPAELVEADFARYGQLQKEATTGKGAAQILAAFFLGRRLEDGKNSALKLGDEILAWNPGYEVAAFTEEGLHAITEATIAEKADKATITGALVMVGEDKRYISFEDANKLFVGARGKLEIVQKDPKDEGKQTGPIIIEVLADSHKVTCAAVLKNAGLGIGKATYEEKTLEVTLDNLAI